MLLRVTLHFGGHASSYHRCRFGDVVSCDIIRDTRTGQSLQYAFVGFKKKEECEAAYFKMQNVLVDDRRCVVMCRRLFPCVEVATSRLHTRILVRLVFLSTDPRVCLGLFCM